MLTLIRKDKHLIASNSVTVEFSKAQVIKQLALTQQLLFELILL